jgi:predicted TIM-barrel fold metal-dependent hydrolase
MGALFPIVDAHQHFWDPRVNYHPWLCDQPPIPFRYGDYSALRRPYLPADYFADANGHQVVKTVYVETEWDPRDPLGEMHYVARLRRETGFPTVAVAQAWLDREDLGTTLAALGEFAFVRGIRHKPRPGQMTGERWRAGFAQLTKRGLRFDLQAPWTQFGEAAQLARDFPDAAIIVNHTGLPADRSRAGIAGWKDALRTLADRPNAALKVSGLGLPRQQWTVQANREIVLAAIEIFGIGRAMFASNFPVDGLCASFDTIVTGMREILRDFPAGEQRAFFHDNAVRIYDMEKQ